MILLLASCTFQDPNLNNTKIIQPVEVVITPITDDNKPEEALLVEEQTFIINQEEKEFVIEFAEFSPQYGGEAIKEKEFSIPDYLLKIDLPSSQKPILLSYKNQEQQIFGKSKVNVAAILPFTGVYAVAGKKIRNALIKENFASSFNFAQLHFYDSSTPELNNLYQNLVEKGYDILIGPLEEDNIDKIEFSSSVINIPLNFQKNPTLSTYPIHFKVNEEVNQIIEASIKKGYCRAILLVENSLEGETFADQFVTRWFDNGNIVSKVMYLGDSMDNNAKMIKNELQITPKWTERHYDKDGLEIRVEEGVEDFPFIRQDIDVIVNVLPTDKSRLIYPVMKLIGGTHIPVLSSSLISKSSDFNPQKEQDLRNIEYLDSIWRYEDEKIDIFYSIGIDAYRLANAIWKYPRFNYAGYTNKYFYLESYGMQTLKYWYKFKGRKAVRLL